MEIHHKLRAGGPADYGEDNPANKSCPDKPSQLVYADPPDQH